MHIIGRRVHIAGSADSSLDPNLLRYAHELVTQLVKAFMAEGAMFITGIGKDPLSIPDDPNSLPIIFDWTALSAIYECLQQGVVSISDFAERLIYTVGKDKTERQIPDSRRDLWESLLAADAIEIDYLKPGRASGELYRQRQVLRGDILIILGGGEGVESLADLYMENGKPVIPLDIQIGCSYNDGNGGAPRLAMKMLAEPHTFVRISDTSAAGNLVTGLTTRQGKRPVREVVQGIVKLIQALKPPSTDNHVESSTYKNLILQSNNQAQSSEIDVLVITALKDELDALLKCVDESSHSWQEYKDSQGFSYYKQTFKHSNGILITVAAARAVSMGELHAANVAIRLIQELKPSCIAMTGICAGRQGEVFLGDVIVADRVFKIDSGKLKAYDEQQGSEVIRKEEIFHDIQTYNLLPLWKHQVENLSKDWVKTIKGNRPRSFFHQNQWLLHKLYNHEIDSDKEPSPLNHPERKQECPAWAQVVQQLVQKRLLKKKGLGLTATAKRKVEQERLQYPDCLPSDPLEPEVRVAPIGTSSMVQQDPQLFSRLEKIGRKTLGVEMESAAIGAVAELHQLPMVIVKSVSDYGDHEKDDQFRHYAAETSARFLLAFLKKSWLPRLS